MSRVQGIARANLALALIATTILAGAARADGFIILTPPSPEIRLTPLWVKNHDVKVKIEGQVATTSVDQVFFNPNGMQLEGTYIFPIPENAGIEALSLWIEGVEQKAELLDADKARNIYEGIVRSMRDPALLEYVGRRAFKLRVFPIPAHGERRVKLSYRETLPADSGMARYLYPLNTEKFSSQPLERVLVDIDLSSTKPLGNIVVLSHKTEIKRIDDLHARITYEARNITPDRDFFLNFGSTTKDIGLDIVAHRIAGEDGYALIALEPRHEIDQSAINPKDVVFVFDNSGSMHGARFKQATSALSFCVDTLRAGDRFEIVNFSTEAHSLFGQLSEFNEANVAKAREKIAKLEPLGGTNIDEALKVAQGLAGSADRQFMIVFLTDGQPTIGETTNVDEILSRVKKRGASNQRIFAFGVGSDVNTDLLDRLAGENRGTRDYVAENEDIEVKVGNLWKKIGSPVLADVQLIASGGASLVETYPRKLPDLFHGVQLLVTTRYQGSGPTAIRLKGKIGGVEKEFVYECRFPETESTNDYLPRLWAVRKVGYMLDEIHIHGANKELIDEVVRLSKKYGIMTPYTSYLVVEDQVTTARRETPRPNSVVDRLDDAPGFGAAPSPAAPAMDSADARGPEEAKSALRRAFARGGDEGARSDPALAPGGSGRAGGNSRDRADLDAEAESFDQFGGERAAEGLAGEQGELAVRASRFIERLKSASEVKDAASSLAGEVVGRIEHAGTRTFYAQGRGWVQAELYDLAGELEVVKITAFSDEYFAMLAANPELAKIFALGDTICFLDGKRVVLITV